MVRGVALALVLLLAPPAAAQAPFFVQVDGRAALPIGDWADHLSFPDQSHFSPGPGGNLAVGWAPGGTRYFTVGVEGGYTLLGTHEWERFAARRVGRVDASARMWSAMAAGTVSLPGRGRGPIAAELHGALGLLVPSGEERFRGRTTDYDFLRPTLGARLGGRAVWRFEALDFWLGCDVLVAPGAVQPTEPLPSAERPIARNPVRRTLAAVEPGMGLRWWFGD